MWRSKRFIIAMVLTAVVAVGSIGGVALAQDNEEEAPAAEFGNLLERACAIYEDNTGVAIDQEAFREAMAQAQSEIQAAAMEARLDKMVENGVIDEAQAQEFLEWWESRPDVPLMAGMDGHGMLRGSGGPGGFGPPEGSEPPE
jgi:dihydroorotase-like cyclic amidohydrolase